MRRVLFLCVANRFRSQIAEALFNHMAPPGLEAISAGILPNAPVSTHAAALLRGRGIDIGLSAPKLVTPEMAESADRIIAVGPEAEVLTAVPERHVERWGIADPDLDSPESPRQAFLEVEARVRSLIQEMTDGAGNTKPLVDRLGIKPGGRVCLVGVNRDLEAEIRTRLAKGGHLYYYGGCAALTGEGDEGFDVALFAARNAPEVTGCFSSLKAHMACRGAVWAVLSRKGADPNAPAEAEVRGAGLEAGLVDVKVSRISDREYALKFVIPRRNR